jgi:predicted dehydrogenase
MSEARKVRWGIISTASIGIEKVIPAIQKSPHSQALAIASRNRSSARAAADKLGIAKAYGSYEDLLADPDIDAIYNPLPNHLHVPLTLEANRAGKHVLCEKPISITADEAMELRQARPDLLIMEGFMVRFHPQWLRAREIMRSGELGEVRAIRAAFSYFNADPANVRNKADIGGGALLDIGGYPITGGRFFFEVEPLRAVSLLDRDPVFGTDRQVSAIVDFGQGRHLTFSVSTQLVPSQSMELIGTKGRVEIIIPYNAPQDQATALLVDAGHTFDASLARREILPPSDQYAEMAEAFALAVLGKSKLPYGVEDAIASMRVIDAISDSAQNSRWENI